MPAGPDVCNIFDTLLLYQMNIGIAYVSSWSELWRVRNYLNQRRIGRAISSRPRRCGRHDSADEHLPLWSLASRLSSGLSPAPFFHYSDTWQLVINTGTTIVTFLMVFLIQNTQNRDMSALHLKLDELIRVNQDARNKLLNLEDLTEEELEKLKGTFARLAVSKVVKPEKAAAAIEDLEQAEEDIGEAKRKIGSA
jgi:low affinity Fe/Cu permease